MTTLTGVVDASITLTGVVDASITLTGVVDGFVASDEPVYLTLLLQQVQIEEEEE